MVTALALLKQGTEVEVPVIARVVVVEEVGEDPVEDEVANVAGLDAEDVVDSTRLMGHLHQLPLLPLLASLNPSPFSIRSSVV